MTTTSAEPLLVDHRDRVTTLTLNRPEKHNAMSGEMLVELKVAAEQLAADESVRVVVLTGAGKSFCAGGDLGWMRAQRDMDADTRGREARKLAEMLQALNTLPHFNRAVGFTEKPVGGKTR